MFGTPKPTAYEPPVITFSTQVRMFGQFAWQVIILVGIKSTNRSEHIHILYLSKKCEPDCL